jgi:RHS repeat-associated protein
MAQATLRPSGSGVTVYYVHTDQLNTPRQVTRPSDNALMWTWYSDPFGTDAANANPAGAGTFAYNLRLPGQVFDGQVGLHSNYFRDFDPASGRYVESDPLGLGGGSYSTYAYGGGNPINNIDPSGRFVFPAAPAVAAPIATSVAAVAGAAAVGYGIGTLIYNGVAVPLQDALEIAFPYSTGSGGAGSKPPQPPASTTGGCPPEEPRKFSKNKSLGKWANQLQQRGWTLQQIEDAIQNGQSLPAQNLINPANGATRYVSPETGQSVVIDNVTGEVIHVGGPGFQY